MSDRPRILIAGIGNIFHGDDAFGVEVAQRLLRRPAPPRWDNDVRVVDFGIRGLDLTYALLDTCDVAILVDAVPRGGAPGTLYIIEPDSQPDTQDGAVDSNAGVAIEAHGMDPAKVLRLVRAMGGQAAKILVVGCEPAALGSDDDMAMGLSEPVAAAIDGAIAMIDSLIDRIHAGDPAVTPHPVSTPAHSEDKP